MTNPLPRYTPTKYAINEPTRFPMDPAIMTAMMLNFPVETRYPENGIMTSLGIGISALSATIKKKIPRYPEFDIVWMIKFVRLLIISRATKIRLLP